MAKKQRSSWNIWWSDAKVILAIGLPFMLAMAVLHHFFPLLRNIIEGLLWMALLIIALVNLFTIVRDKYFYRKPKTR